MHAGGVGGVGGYRFFSRGVHGEEVSSSVGLLVGPPVALRLGTWAALLCSGASRFACSLSLAAIKCDVAEFRLRWTISARNLGFYLRFVRVKVSVRGGQPLVRNAKRNGTSFKANESPLNPFRFIYCARLRPTERWTESPQRVNRSFRLESISLSLVCSRYACSTRWRCLNLFVCTLIKY